MPHRSQAAQRTHMNCTSQNTIDANTAVSPLKARCKRMGIDIPGDNPTPLQIIPIIQKQLALHQKYPSKDAGPRSGDYAEWKIINDHLTEFLDQLRAAALTQVAAISAARNKSN